MYKRQPHDLRLPFARLLAHNPSLNHLKRYAIDRVYRERRVLGLHPRELYECAFDIVTSTPGIFLFVVQFYTHNYSFLTNVTVVFVFYSFHLFQICSLVYKAMLILHSFSITKRSMTIVSKLYSRQR